MAKQQSGYMVQYRTHGWPDGLWQFLLPYPKDTLEQARATIHPVIMEDEETETRIVHVTIMPVGED